MDYASPKTKALGEEVITKELKNIPNETVRKTAVSYLNKIALGERDFRF